MILNQKSDKRTTQLELTPDEAISLASLLLKEALLVKNAQRKLPDAYEYVRLPAFSPDGTESRILNIRLGAL